jgi:ABC-type transporter MlaC component
VLLLLHTQVITKVVLGMELTPQQRTEFENEFRVWLKHVSSTVIINIHHHDMACAAGATVLQRDSH